MSRIGNNPIQVPSGVDVAVKGANVTVKGPKGTLDRTFDERITIAMDDGTVTLTRVDDERESKALHGLSRALLANMVIGVSEGYSKELQAVGVGYRANLQGRKLELQLGFSHPVVVEAPDGVDFEVPEPTRIIVSGIDKELVGQTAANIRSLRPPEPYKGKGLRYSNETVRRKAGKAGIA
ncbi:MAG TPA: 50S ribosomal protein L6 [Vicinamibacterales bacterium]|jgi:large subunit ribosomal protein L6|nr:50S ribosomal protein L6 [Vicinamibacterales bacterium]